MGARNTQNPPADNIQLWRVVAGWHDSKIIDNVGSSESRDGGRLLRQRLATTSR
jgi:hypothetical protein